MLCIMPYLPAKIPFPLSTPELIAPFSTNPGLMILSEGQLPGHSRACTRTSLRSPAITVFRISAGFFPSPSSRAWSSSRSFSSAKFEMLQRRSPAYDWRTWNLSQRAWPVVSPPTRISQLGLIIARTTPNVHGKHIYRT